MEQTISQPKSTPILRKSLIILGPLLLFIVLGVMAANLGEFESTELRGRKAPNFSMPLFDQFEQDEITLAELKGQVVVVNFWASWCVECFREAALLEQAWRDYQDQGVIFIGVDYLDTDKEGPRIYGQIRHYLSIRSRYWNQNC